MVRKGCRVLRQDRRWARHGDAYAWLLPPLAVVLPALLVACASSGPPTPDEGFRNYIDTPPWETKDGMTGSAGSTLFNSHTRNANAGGETGGGGLGVNAFLWRGALDTLSFMPLASADPFGGIIITDWYSPPSATGERFKANAYILGRQLRADGIKVAIFRQVDQGGTWVDAPVAPGTVAEIENKVLAKARELRAQSASSQ